MGKSKKRSMSKHKSKKKKRSYSSSSSEDIISRRKHKRKYSSSSNSSSDIEYKNKQADRRRKYSSDSNSDEEYKNINKKADSRKYSSTSDLSSKEECKQKPRSESPIHPPKTENPEPKLQRDSWMDIHSKFLTSSNSDRKKERNDQKKLEREKQQYDPSKCDRELNPYWKHGGDGLPTFKKPQESDSDNEKSKYKSSNRYSGTSNWRKKEHTDTNACSSSSNINQKDPPKIEEPPKQAEDKDEYSEKDLNIVAAKLVKAEIMGKTKLIQDLKEKLEHMRNSVKPTKEAEDVILFETDSRGQSKPLARQSEYGESSKRRKKKIETHENQKRVRYFADDDKYSLKQMFEYEKYNTGADQDKEFLQSFSKLSKNNDLDDIFSDNIRQKESGSKTDEKNKSKAINHHQKVTQSLDNCTRCLQSESMLKHLMISMGDTVYLALPSYEPLTEGHCLIIPIRHTPCVTQLDENEWDNIRDVRKSLVKMFQSQNKTTVFFECAMSQHKFPHMIIECIPMPVEEGDMAPIYFKKAIDESEMEWAQNKKLVSLKGRDVRKAIPKGLAYFSVSFGMEEGFAHVIEDEQLFPSNFAQEIIGGMLDLHHSKWRKPKRQNFEEQSKRVMEFSTNWTHFDCLSNY